MKRRALLSSLGALGAVSSLAPGPVTASEAASAITNLWMSIMIDLSFKNYVAARQNAEQFYQLKQYDPKWRYHPESFLIARTLVELTSPADRRAWLSANIQLLDTFPGAGIEGHMRDNWRTIAGAAYAALQADNAGPRLLSPAEHGRVANYLLVLSSVTSGEKRAALAQLGLRETRRSGTTALDSWRRDGVTSRMEAAGVAVAGDWIAAAGLYGKIVGTSQGAMEHALSTHTDNALHGLLDTEAGVTTVEAEAASVYAMAGQYERAIALLEGSRRGTLAARQGSTTAALSAVMIEDRLTRDGVVIVQPVASWVGVFALVSVRRKGKLQRFAVTDLENGGEELNWRLLSSEQKFLGGKNGLLPRYIAVRKTSPKKSEAAFEAYAERAIAEAEALCGQTTRKALIKAGVGAGDDVLVILPATLAVLPINLARSSTASPCLGQQFKLRFADSLSNAWRAHTAPRAHEQTSIALFSPVETDLPSVAFELASVASHSPDASRRNFAPKGNASVELTAADGCGYWHIACHAAWNFKAPERSGIALAKKKTATVADVLAMNLHSPPRLVYLSACETAMVDIKGRLSAFVGLPTAFLAKGATACIGALWPVSDRASSLLAARFYDEHLLSKVEPAQALRNAQQWLASAKASDLAIYVDGQIEHERISPESGRYLSGELHKLDPGSRPYAHPYFWGGFQLYGQ